MPSNNYKILLINTGSNLAGGRPGPPAHLNPAQNQGSLGRTDWEIRWRDTQLLAGRRRSVRWRQWRRQATSRVSYHHHAPAQIASLDCDKTCRLIAQSGMTARTSLDMLILYNSTKLLPVIFTSTATFVCTIIVVQLKILLLLLVCWPYTALVSGHMKMRGRYFSKLYR